MLSSTGGTKFGWSCRQQTNKESQCLNVFVFSCYKVDKLTNNVDHNLFEILQATTNAYVTSQSFNCCLVPLFFILNMKRVKDKAGIVEQINSLFFVLTEVWVEKADSTRRHSKQRAGHVEGFKQLVRYNCRGLILISCGASHDNV